MKGELKTSKEKRQAQTYISTLFNPEVYTQQTFGIINIIENGIGSAKNKTKQVKRELIKLGTKVQSNLTEGKLLRQDNKLTRIEFRTAISTWNPTTRPELKDLIIKENIFYVIQFTKIPEFETRTQYKIFLQDLESKLKSYKTNEKRNLLKDLRDINFHNASEIIYQLITGRKRIKGDLRGAIAESTSKYTFNLALYHNLKLTPNFTIYEDRIRINTTEIYLDNSKEIDFILTGGDRISMKQFRQNLENKGLGIIINDEYEGLILGKQGKFYQGQKLN